MLLAAVLCFKMNTDHCKPATACIWCLINTSASVHGPLFTLRLCFKRMKNSKWVWSGNTTITICRLIHGTARKSHTTIAKFVNYGCTFRSLTMSIVSRSSNWLLLYSYFGLVARNPDFAAWEQPRRITACPYAQSYHLAFVIRFLLSAFWKVQ